jgi:hypothetical protein
MEGGGAKGFLRDVARDYRNFISIDTAKWLAAGGTAAVAMHAADDMLHDSDEVIDALSSMSGGQEYGNASFQVPIAIGWWVVGAAAHSPRDADAGRDLVRAQISATSWTYAFKYTVSRTRPNGDPRSFPSGHASATFATAMVLQQHYGWKLGVPAFAAAGYTAASRIVDDKHWASDVVFGAVLGMTTARTVTIHVRETRLAIAPLPVPGGAGVLVSASR